MEGTCSINEEEHMLYNFDDEGGHLENQEGDGMTIISRCMLEKCEVKLLLFA